MLPSSRSRDQSGSGILHRLESVQNAVKYHLYYTCHVVLSENQVIINQLKQSKIIMIMVNIMVKQAVLHIADFTILTDTFNGNWDF